MVQINTYLTPHDYLREATGQETTSLIGNLLKLTGSGVAQGATSLPVSPNTTANLAVNDPIYIFDGANTEIVFVSSTTNAGASSIPVSATAYAHASGTSCISDGRLGSLGELLIEGSAAVERITQQPLLQASYTDTLSLLTMRAVVDNTSRMVIRPRQFPVTALSSITIEYDASSTVNIDTTQAIIESPGKIIKIPVIKNISAGSGYQLTQYLDQTSEGNVVISYTAGYAYASLPYTIKRCAVWLTSDLMSDRINPTGAAETGMGEQRIVGYLRGDFSGESALVKRARRYLAPYTQGAW